MHDLSVGDSAEQPIGPLLPASPDLWLTGRQPSFHILVFARSILESPMASTNSDKFSPLVLIQKGSSVPFFCVHGAGGNVLNFRSIAMHLGEKQTFFGLQAKGVDGSTPLQSIEEMAALYLPEVLRTQPNGPFMLGGYSGGGNVAYEMAQQLVKLGKKVALLVLLDTFRSGITPRRPAMSDHLRLLGSKGPAYLAKRARARLARFQWESVESMKRKFYTMLGQPMPYELRELDMTRTFWDASDRYVPTAYAGGPVNLYRASEIAEIYQHAGPKLGWDGLIPELTVVEVPGDHDSLVHEPNVTVMTSHLRASLIAAARA